jgi:hypothetical protein
MTPLRIVFKPGPMADPVQGPGFGFWPGRQVGRVNLYFKKIQNGVFLVKKKQKKTKVNGLQPGFWPGFAGSTRWVGQVTPGHDFSYFFINLARFQPRVDPPGFKTMLLRPELHGYLRTKYVGNSYILNSCKRKPGDLNTTPDVSEKDLQFIIFRIIKISIQ